MIRSALIGLVLALLAACGAETPGESGDAALSLLRGEADDRFARVTGPRAFRFPTDHGAHPDYQSEWWYLTGNLRDGDREFGYQLTIFRFALAPERPAGGAWASRQLWLAQLAVTDIGNERFYTAERISRGVPGLAGAAVDPFEVHVEDMRIVADAEDPLDELLLEARGAAFGLELELSAQRPIVLQGDRGFSPKSDEPGNASHYYSVPRLATRGTITVGETPYQVSGLSWLDREWSTSALGPEQAGWDWFALQLDDGSDLMFYRLRGEDGSTGPHSAGVLVEPDGEVRRLDADALVVEALETWRSPATGIGYPVSWRLTGARLELRVTAKYAAQEHHARFRYWEGAVAVTGRRNGAPVGGSGYLEMTGYQ